MKKQGKNSPIKAAVDVVFVICVAISAVSTVVYLITKRVVPGLSPFALAIALFIVAGGMRMKRRNNQDNADFVEIVFMVAAFLNVFVGFMQIHAYMLGR